MDSKQDIHDTLNSLIECLDRIGRAYTFIESVKDRYPNEISLDSLAYGLFSELQDAYSLCMMGCAHAERLRYNKEYYENKEAQAIDALRCLMSEIARRLSLILYEFHGELSWAMSRRKELPDSTIRVIQGTVFSIAGITKVISEKVENIRKILKDDEN